MIWTLHDEFGWYPKPAHRGDTPKTTTGGLNHYATMQDYFSTSLRSCLTPQNGETPGENYTLQFRLLSPYLNLMLMVDVPHHPPIGPSGSKVPFLGGIRQTYVEQLMIDFGLMNIKPCQSMCIYIYKQI